jgi:hypothetical protein
MHIDKQLTIIIDVHDRERLSQHKIINASKLLRYHSSDVDERQ